VRVEILLRDAVRLREFLADEDAPEHHVGIEAALLRQAEDPLVQLLPLGELLRRPLAGLGKILRPDHVSERMHGPQRDRVEAVLDHHVEEALPEYEVAHRVVMLVERGARTIGIPGRVELDAAESQRGPLGDGHHLVDGLAVEQLLAQFERAVDEPRASPPVTVNWRPSRLTANASALMEGSMRSSNTAALPSADMMTAGDSSASRSRREA
jgi:hypothetical protein